MPLTYDVIDHFPQLKTNEMFLETSKFSYIITLMLYDIRYIIWYVICKSHYITLIQTENTEVQKGQSHNHTSFSKASRDLMRKPERWIVAWLC